MVLAGMEKNIGCSIKTVGRMCVTGTPDQFNTCSESQCCCCWCESVISSRLISDTVICDMFTRISRFPSCGLERGVLFTLDERKKESWVEANLSGNGSNDGSRLEISGDDAQAEIDAATSLHGPHYVARALKIPDNNFSSKATKLLRTLILPVNHGSNWAAFL